MCMNCPDFVTYCAQDECYTPDGGPYSKIRKFYINNEYCRHLKEIHKHDLATWEDRDKNEDDE